MERSLPRLPWSLFVQVAIALPLVGGLLLTPPVEGAMILVPLTPAAARALPALAFTGRTKLVSAGALAGSLVVYGRRAGLAGPLFAHAILTFASPLTGCASKATA